MYCGGRAPARPAMLKWLGLVPVVTAGWMGC